MSHEEALLRRIIECWQFHFTAPLPSVSFLSTWKISNFEDLDFALSLAAQKFGRSPNDVRGCAAYASGIVRNLKNDRQTLARIQAEREKDQAVMHDNE